MPLTFALIDRVLDTYKEGMRREALRDLAYGNPLYQQIYPDKYPDWDMARRLHTEFPSITRSPFDGVDWNMVIAPAYTTAYEEAKLARHRAELHAQVDAGDFDFD